MDKMSSVDSPAPDLHGGDQINTISIALCIRSGCAIYPAATHICTSLAERPVAGRVCVIKVYLGAQAGHVHTNAVPRHCWMSKKIEFPKESRRTNPTYTFSRADLNLF